VQDPEARANEPKWRIWERAAAELEASYPDCHVILDHKAVGRRSGIERQIDVWVTGTVGPHQVNIAVECKCLRQRVSIKDIEAFYSFLDDVGANKGVMISESGFTSGARARAHESDMELMTLTLRQAEELDWSTIWEQEWHEEHRKHYTCHGCNGDLTFPYEGFAKGGHCQSCGQFYIWCNRCDTVLPYDLETNEKHQFHYVRCKARSGRGRCVQKWRLYFEDGLLESIKDAS
jgi:hypothetical protein